MDGKNMMKKTYENKMRKLAEDNKTKKEQYKKKMKRISDMNKKAKEKLKEAQDLRAVGVELGPTPSPRVKINQYSKNAQLGKK